MYRDSNFTQVGTFNALCLNFRSSIAVGFQNLRLIITLPLTTEMTDHGTGRILKGVSMILLQRDSPIPVKVDKECTQLQVQFNLNQGELALFIFLI
jgi:hypothetical protein